MPSGLQVHLSPRWSCEIQPLYISRDLAVSRSRSAFFVLFLIAMVGVVWHLVEMTLAPLKPPLVGAGVWWVWLVKSTE